MKSSGEILIDSFFIEHNINSLFEVDAIKYNEFYKPQPSLCNNKLHLLLLCCRHLPDFIDQFKNLLPGIPDVQYALNQNNSRAESPLDLIHFFNITSLIQYIEENYPDAKTAPALNAKDQLFNAAKLCNQSEFLKLIKNNPDLINSTDGSEANTSSCTLLELCCFNGLEECVKYLLSNGVDVNHQVSKRSPVKIAIEMQQFEIMRMLIERYDFQPSELILLDTFKYLVTKQYPIETIEQYMASLLATMFTFHKEKLGKMINLQDNFEKKTLLHYAAICKANNTVVTLCKMNANLYIEDSEKKFPFQYMENNLFCRLLTSYIDEQPNEEYDLYYEQISSDTQIKEKEPTVENQALFLKCIIDNKKLHKALVHPIIAIYIQMRWHRLFFFYYLFEILVNSISLFGIIFYVFYNTADRPHLAPYVMLAVSFAATLLLECFNFLILFGKKNFKNVDFYINVILLIGELIIMIYYFYLHTAASNYLKDYIVVTSSIVVLANFLNTFLQLSKFEVWTYKIELFKTVSLNFIKYCLFYSAPLIAFTLCFYMLNDAKATKDISSFAMTLYDTLVMFTGDADNKYPEEHFPENVRFGRTMYVIFIIIIALAMQNLLTALAIGKVDQIQSRKEFISELLWAEKIIEIDENAANKPTNFVLKAIYNKVVVPLHRQSNLFNGPKKVSIRNRVLIVKDDQEKCIFRLSISEKNWKRLIQWETDNETLLIR